METQYYGDYIMETVSWRPNYGDLILWRPNIMETYYRDLILYIYIFDNIESLY